MDLRRENWVLAECSGPQSEATSNMRGCRDRGFAKVKFNDGCVPRESLYHLTLSYCRLRNRRSLRVAGPTSILARIERWLLYTHSKHNHSYNRPSLPAPNVLDK
jgi:hypothetical protein